MTVKEAPPKAPILKSSATSLNINQSGNVIITFTEYGTISFNIADKSIVGCSWGEWNGQDAPLYFTGKRSGTTTVTITNSVNSEKVVIQVTVDLGAKSISLDTTSATLSIGEKLTLNATVLPAYAENKDVKWYVDNSNVVSLSSFTNTGYAVAESEGTAVVTVVSDSGNHKATCTIKVVNPIKVKLPVFPKTVSTYDLRGNLLKTCSISNIDYKVSKNIDASYTIRFSINGEKTFDSSGNSTSAACKIGYKLYDKNGIVVKSGVAYTTSIATGEKFVIKELAVYDLNAGEYELVLLDVK